MNRPLMAFIGLVITCTSSGCGQTFGGLLYHFNILQRPSIPARYKLNTGPLLILVDDDLSLLTWSQGRDLLANEIGRHLREAGVKAQVIPNHKLDAMRRADPLLDGKSISEIGKALGAEQVLWLQFREFVAIKQVQTAVRAARCTMRVKVFDPHAKSKAEMRVWPSFREGEFVSISKSASELIQYAGDAEVARMIVEETADAVAKLFYKHRPDE